jgi:hypothetical protein
MKNRIEEREVIKRNVSEPTDKKMVKDQARADDDGFALEKNNVAVQPPEDSDCWSDLWQRIKTKGFHFLQ